VVLNGTATTEDAANKRLKKRVENIAQLERKKAVGTFYVFLGYLYVFWVFFFIKKISVSSSIAWYDDGESKQPFCVVASK
jgi:hypothetical protein